MRKSFILIPLLLGLAAPIAAHADPIPATVADMIRAAAKSGSASQLAVTVKVAKNTNPHSIHEIDALVSQLKIWADATLSEDPALQRSLLGLAL